MIKPNVTRDELTNMIQQVISNEMSLNKDFFNENAETVQFTMDMTVHATLLVLEQLGLIQLPTK